MHARDVPSLSNPSSSSMDTFSRSKLTLSVADQPRFQRPGPAGGGELSSIDPRTPASRPPPNIPVPSFCKTAITEIRPLGSGTYGTVSLVKVHRLGRAAFKQGIAQCFALNGRQMTREKRELLCNIMLNHHPNIVAFYGEVYEHDPAYPYGFLMEYLPNGSLSSYINSHLEKPDAFPVYLKLKNSWVYQIAIAISYMHGRNIMHRDLNPNNILIGVPNHIAKLTDFGHSKIGDENDRQTKSNTIMVGTSFYRAPEVLVDSHYNYPIDVYSFAMTTYFIFAKMHPFQGMEGFNNISSFTAMTKLICADSPRPQLGFGQIDPLIALCWKTDPSERPEMDQIVEELDLYIPDQMTGQIMEKYPRVEEI